MSFEKYRSSDIADKYSGILDPRFGIGGKFVLRHPLNLNVKQHILSLKGHYDFHRRVNVPSGGSARVRMNDMLRPGFAEFIERYSLGVVPRKSLTKQMSIEEMNRTCPSLSLEEIRQLRGIHPMQHSIQYNFLKPIKPETEFVWTEAKYLFDDSPVWVPELSIVMKLNDYFLVTTNGSAIHTTKNEAFLKAAYELIERDSFLHMWWRKEKIQFIDFKEELRKIDPGLYLAFGPWLDFVHLGYYPDIFNIPVFFAMFRSSNSQGHPAFLVAGSANLNPQKALISSLNELGSLLNHQFQIYQIQGWEGFRKLYNFDRDIKTFDDHTYIYMFDEYADKIHFSQDLLQAETKLKFSDIGNFEKMTNEENRLILIQKFRDAGFNPIVVNQTSDDVSALGLHVTRILDPKSIGLNSMHCLRMWGKERLYGGRVKSVVDLNQLPHPFP